MECAEEEARRRRRRRTDLKFKGIGFSFSICYHTPEAIIYSLCVHVILQYMLHAESNFQFDKESRLNPTEAGSESHHHAFSQPANSLSSDKNLFHSHHQKPASSSSSSPLLDYYLTSSSSSSSASPTRL